jgi:hypothetical protein
MLEIFRISQFLQELVENFTGSQFQAQVCVKSVMRTGLLIHFWTRKLLMDV